MERSANTLIPQVLRGRCEGEAPETRVEQHASTTGLGKLQSSLQGKEENNCTNQENGL